MPGGLAQADGGEVLQAGDQGSVMAGRQETVLGFNGLNRISDDKKKMNFTSRQASEAVCQQQFGANLVSIDTPEEAEKLCDIVSDRYCVLCCCFYRFQ